MLNGKLLVINPRSSVVADVFTQSVDHIRRSAKENLIIHTPDWEPSRKGDSVYLFIAQFIKRARDDSKEFLLTDAYSKYTRWCQYMKRLPEREQVFNDIAINVFSGHRVSGNRNCGLEKCVGGDYCVYGYDLKVM